MSEPWFEEWVAKAEQDHYAASVLDAGTVPDVVCFLCQQCAEKYLKAALARFELPTRKTTTSSSSPAWFQNAMSGSQVSRTISPS